VGRSVTQPCNPVSISFVVHTSRVPASIKVTAIVRSDQLIQQLIGIDYRR